MPPPQWSCDCCCECFRDYTSVDIDGSPVCVACIRRMFDKALKFEHDYPPNWAGPLHPSEFSHIFSEDYIESYKQKEIEYRTPITKRIYCQHVVSALSLEHGGEGGASFGRCGEFIGPRQRGKPDMLILGRCKSCKSATCMVCDDYHDPGTLFAHLCPGKSCANESRAKAFLGLKRGKDWQECPSRLCGRRIELSAACNHITCQCGIGFCFICGKEADGESDHWRKGGCPRYNQPGDDDVEYDEYGYDDDDALTVSDVDDFYDDPLENVRALFGDEEDGDPAAVQLQGNVLNPPAVDDRLNGTPAEAQPQSQMQHITSEEREREPEAVANALNSLFDENRQDPGEQVAAPVVSSLRRLSLEYDTRTSRDADAIARMYDEWSGEDDSESLRPGFMSIEDVDIDHVLWRMRID